MSTRAVFMILSAALILFTMHWLFFRSIVAFFTTGSPFHKTAAYALMIVLTAIVLTGFAAARMHDGWWVTGYYWFAASWMGFLVHFLAAVLAAWILIGVCRIAKIPAGRSAIAALLLTGAFIYSIYGIFNAFSPRVHTIPVAIDHVPASWENSKIVHLSDIHLGRMHGAGFAKKLVQRVNDIEPDIVLITGDIFDGLGGESSRGLVTILDGIRAARGVFYVSGNHEGYIGRQKALRLLEKTTITGLENNRIEIDGLELIGISYGGIHSIDEIAGLPGKIDKGNNVRILLYHTPTTIMAGSRDRMDRHFATYWMPDTSFSQNRETRADLQLSGHTHQGQLFPFNLLTRLIYKGFHYGLNRSGDLYVYTTSGAGTWGPPMRTTTASEIAVIRLIKSQ